MALPKRQRDDDAHPPIKKRKSDHHCPDNFPPAFWDSLSEIFLTRRALRELDRRNTINAPARTKSDFILSNRSRLIRRRGPLTRGASRELERRNSTTRLPEPRIKHATALEVAKFARRGGPDLTDLRGFPELEDSAVAMASKASSSKSSSKRSGSRKTRPTAPTTVTEDARKTVKSSAYDRNFEGHHVDHGIYPPEYDYGDEDPYPEPSNYAELQTRLNAERASLSPSRVTELQFRRFKMINRTASEATVEREIIPILFGDSNRPSDRQSPWNNMRSMTNNTTVKPVPDYYEGARPQALRLSIREDPSLNSLIIPTTDRSKPISPSFTGEHKGQSGSSIVAERQAMANGAHGVRSTEALENFGLETPVYNEAAKAGSYTYHNGTVKLYAHHSTPSRTAGRDRDYHMTQLGGYDLTHSRDSFRQGAAAMRNLGDHFGEDLNRTIQAANARAGTSGLYGEINDPGMQQSYIPTPQSTDYSEFDYLASQDDPPEQDPASLSFAPVYEEPASFAMSFTSTTDPHQPSAYSKRVQSRSPPSTTVTAKRRRSKKGKAGAGPIE